MKIYKEMNEDHQSVVQTLYWLFEFPDSIIGFPSNCLQTNSYFTFLVMLHRIKKLQEFCDSFNLARV